MHSAAEICATLILSFVDVQTQSEIDEFDNSQIFRNDDIVKLDVAMGYRYSMQEQQSIRDIFKYLFNLILLEFSLPHYPGKRVREIFKN